MRDVMALQAFVDRVHMLAEQEMANNGAGFTRWLGGHGGVD